MAIAADGLVGRLGATVVVVLLTTFLTYHLLPRTPALNRTSMRVHAPQRIDIIGASSQRIAIMPATRNLAAGTEDSSSDGSHKQLKNEEGGRPITRRKRRPAAINVSVFPADSRILFIGSGEVGDLFTALCQAVHATEANSQRWCPDYDDHIHDEYLQLPQRTVARYVYWDGQQPLELRGYLCTKHPAARWAWPTHAVVGRGILDLYHFNPALDAVEATTRSALRRLSAALADGAEAFCAEASTTAEKDTLRRVPPGRLLWVLPRYVPERPYHVGCTTEARQVALMQRFQLVGDVLPDFIRMVDLWSPTRAWPNGAFDWRGLSPRRPRRYKELLSLVLQAFVRSTSRTTAAVALAYDDKFSVPWGPEGGRHCNAANSYDDWFRRDTADRLKPTTFWKQRRGVAWRVPKHRFGPPTRWQHRKADIERMIRERNVPPPSGPIDIHWDGAPCGSVPTPFDEDWQYNMRQVGTKWPTKPSSPEVPCHALLSPAAPPAGLSGPPMPEPLGQPRCLFFWGPAEAADNNWPEVDLEGCLAHGQVRMLIIGSSHQEPRNLEFKWFSKKSTTAGNNNHNNSWSPNAVLKGANRYEGDGKGGMGGGTEDAATIHDKWITIDGIKIIGFKWNQMAEALLSVAEENPIGKTWTHVIFGSTTHGNLFQDWTSQRAFEVLRSFLDRLAREVGGAPDRVQVVNQLEVHFRGRQGAPNSSDTCSQEFRIEMYREAALCAAADFYASWKHDESAASTYRRGLRYFNPKPMTKHPLVEILSPIWDGHHYSDTVIGDAMFDHQVRMMCNEWIAEKTSARPLRIRGRDGFGFTGTEEQPEATTGATRSIPSRTGGFPVVSMPRSRNAAIVPYKGDPRHMGIQHTRVCGCVLSEYACKAPEYDVILTYEQLAEDRREKLVEEVPFWQLADDRLHENITTRRRP